MVNLNGPQGDPALKAILMRSPSKGEREVGLQAIAGVSCAGGIRCNQQEATAMNGQAEQPPITIIKPENLGTILLPAGSSRPLTRKLFASWPA